MLGDRVFCFLMTFLITGATTVGAGGPSSTTTYGTSIGMVSVETTGFLSLFTSTAAGYFLASC